MTLTSNQVNKAAEDLFFAEKNRTKIGLLSVEYPNIDMEDALSLIHI